MTTTPRATGSCLCGAVRYEVHGPLRPVIACHCSQCRKTSGNYVAGTAARRADIIVLEDRGLKWYRSSERARRGFCAECGGNLFWAMVDAEHWGIMAGTIDPPTGLATAMHICVADKSDYVVIPQGMPTRDGPDHGVTVPAEEETGA